MDIHVQIHTHKTNGDTGLTLFMKIKSKHVTHLNVKCQRNKLLQENTEENLDDLVFVDEFSERKPKSKGHKRKNQKFYNFKSNEKLLL